MAEHVRTTTSSTRTWLVTGDSATIGNYRIRMDAVVAYYDGETDLVICMEGGHLLSIEDWTAAQFEDLMSRATAQGA